MSKNILKVLFFMILFVLSGLVPAGAATFTVNATSDTVDASPGDGVCADSADACSLRAAIQEANTLSGADVIDVSAGTYLLTIAGANEDAAATGDLDITDDLTITGAGAASTIIDGGALDRVFHVDPAQAGGVVVNISGVTIQNGSLSDDGGIYNATGATLTITNSTISGNTAGHDGGGIYNAAGATLTITNSTISGNTTGRLGGGIANRGTMTITNSTISGNTGSGGGGGIFNAKGATLTITNSTISGNTGDYLGAGAGFFSYGTLDITNSTISGNTTGGTGGGFILRGTVSIINSTIYGNTAGGFGGWGIANNGATVTLKNTIVVNHPTGGYTDCGMSGTYVVTNSLDGDGSCSATIISPIFLDPLADNGGPTQTHALLTDSQAINAGDNASCPAADQRGFNRSDGACDIGAYEEMDLYQLTLATSGSGSVTSSPGKINCPGTCSDQIGDNTVVTLTAVPDANSVFSGWSGDADCLDGEVTMVADTACTATFTPVQYTLTVNINPSGGGTVTGPGINCPGDCTEPAVFGTDIALTAAETAGYTFNAWSGCDSQSGNQCNMTMDADKTVTAVFVVPDITVRDSISPANDLQMPLPDITEGVNSTTETITIKNAGTDDLEIFNIELTGTDKGEFVLDLNGGSNPCGGTPPYDMFLMQPNDDCTVTVTFSPTSTGAKTANLTITSDDPDMGTVNVALSGTGLSAVTNNPPSKPTLVFPANGQQGLPTTVTFKWTPVTDPDGDPVAYDLYYCEDNDPYNNCTSVQVASLQEKTDKPLYAGFGYGGGMILFGIVFAAGFRDRKRIGILAVMVIVAGALLVSCGSHSHNPNYKTYTVTGLNSGAAYYWGVAARDDNGAETQSDIWKFTTR